MPKYTVTFIKNETYEIEAENQYKAEDIGRQMLCDDEWAFMGDTIDKIFVEEVNENKIEDEHSDDAIEFEDSEEFAIHYCLNCGTQKCAGIGTVWFKGCGHKKHLKNYQNFYGDGEE